MNRKLLTQCNFTMALLKHTTSSINKKKISMMVILWSKNLLWLKLRTLVKIKNKIKRKGKMVKNYLNRK